MIRYHWRCGRTMTTIVVSFAAVVIAAASTSWPASAPWIQAIIPDIGPVYDPKDEWANARHCYSTRMYNRLLHAVGYVSAAAADDADSYYYYYDDSRDFSISATRKTMMSGSVPTPHLRHHLPWPFVQCGCYCPRFVGSWMLVPHGSLRRRRTRRTLALAAVADAVVKPMMRGVVVGDAAAAVVVVVPPSSFGQRVVAIAADDMTSAPMTFPLGRCRHDHHHRKQLYRRKQLY